MKKQEGFPGQISYVIPDRILALAQENSLISGLFVTDIGYYPQARHHFRERPSGSEQLILIYCVQGKGEIRLNETVFTIPANYFFIIPAGVSHAYRADEKDPWSIYWIHFTGLKSSAWARFASKVTAIERGRNARISDRTDLFSEIFRNLDRGFSIETLEYVNLCLPYLLASFTRLNQFRLIREPGEKDIVGQSINFMLDHLREKLKLEKIAAETCLSASHFSRLFQNCTGHSPIDYFIQLKIQRACRLLDNSGQTIAEIALEMGFEDQFYFSRLFRKMMGMAPTQYRKRRV
ncbi:transcriptional regulator, AraC family [Aquipluma nitroreducens]|uniref:Transcriptional regulator, AraC family n=1 Tax=Aquipluma nitroreducens TaxID=2010828 RepID=A0A5K7S3N5_9BACT|nr:AraC family transcriptional regulator [Aquipluma nitroreducens]BBE16188.1 transcriptional regulator, AraC family [Aquipluma nitroreducens]